MRGLEPNVKIFLFENMFHTGDVLSKIKCITNGDFWVRSPPGAVEHEGVPETIKSAGDIEPPETIGYTKPTAAGNFSDFSEKQPF